MSRQNNEYQSIQVLNSQVSSLKLMVSTNTYGVNNHTMIGISILLKITMFVITTIAFTRRQRASYSFDLEPSKSVSKNEVAKVSSVLVDVTVRQRQQQRSAMTNQAPAGRQFQPRTQKRRSVRNVYKELGNVYFRRAYRMTYRTFKRLAALLCPGIIAASGYKGTPRHTPNGPISPDVRLASCASRWFVGHHMTL